MAFSLTPFVKTAAALASAVGLFTAEKRRTAVAPEDVSNPARDLELVQADLQKQTLLLGHLASQVEALAAQAANQHRELERIKALLYLALALSILLFAVLLWVVIHH